MKLIHGLDLTGDQYQQVLNAYVHRYTGDHTPRWVSDSPEEYRLLFDSDPEWVQCHAFWFTKAGKLARNRHYAVPQYTIVDGEIVPYRKENDNETHSS